MAKQIRVEHVFKVFGNHPQQALALAREGAGKQQILEKTGQSIGVFDADFTIEAGELFVIMGLSGSGKSTLVRMLNGLIEPNWPCCKPICPRACPPKKWPPPSRR